MPPILGTGMYSIYYIFSHDVEYPLQEMGKTMIVLLGFGIWLFIIPLIVFSALMGHYYGDSPLRYRLMIGFSFGLTFSLVPVDMVIFSDGYEWIVIVVVTGLFLPLLMNPLHPRMKEYAQQVDAGRRT